MRDPVREIVQFNHGRDPERLAMKLQRMRDSPFAFLRGTAHLFYAQLPRHPVLRKAPRTWACGDLHLENLGSYRGDNGQVYFDINDFDEAIRAPATWDLLRLFSSVLVARRLFDSSRNEAREHCASMLDTYARSLVEGNARWVERETAVQPVRGLLASADASHHRALLASRTKNGRIKLHTGRALPASQRDQERVAGLFASLRGKLHEFAGVEVRDVARRIAGTGSLGLSRWVILVDDPRNPEREHLLDLKVASPAAATQFGPKLAQPSFPDEATRIVSVQKRMQAIEMASLHAVKVGRAPFVLRRLQPSEDRVDLRSLKPARVENLLRTVSECLAWDQLRSGGRDGSATTDDLIAFGRDRSWHRPLLELALATAEQVERDYDAFIQAKLS